MLSALLNTPHSEAEWSRWAFHHALSHRVIVDAIKSKFDRSLYEYPLDPIPFNDFPGWLERNQSCHTEMNSVLGAQSSDVEDVDINNQNQVAAWVWLHYLEHQNAERSLGVSS